MVSYPISASRPRPVRAAWQVRFNRKRVLTGLAILVTASLALSAIATAALAVMIARLSPTIPTIAQITQFRPAEATRIYSSDGVLLARLQLENRRAVPLEKVARPLVDATLAMEDHRFYQHRGIDVLGIMRAAWANVTGGDPTGQGGSTITQQLARTVSQFGISRRKTLARKLREAMTAIRIEQALEKDEVLELYLNQIYYGSGAYGVEAAARTYFGKPASRLSLADSALLAGIPQRPETYSPHNNPEGAMRRRTLVLARMLKTGRISREQFDEAKKQPIQLIKRKEPSRIYRAPYFVDWVVKGLTEAFGRDKLYSGLIVTTSLNWRMQKRAEEVVSGPLGYGATQAALVSIDPHTGHVRAMVGGRDYSRNQFNAVTQGLRQPGSAFKPIVYAAAFESGIVDVTSRVYDEKLQLAIDDRNIWTVHNYGGGYSNKERTVLDAIRYSINTVAVNIGLETGLDSVIRCARSLGITTELPPWPSLSLGSGSVRPIELCSAFGVFAANGERYQPLGVLQVTDSNGEHLFNDSPAARFVPPVLSQGTIDQMNFALRATVQAGSGSAASGIPGAHGKTGTTSDHRDVWFVGYTPDLVTTVWAAAPYRDSAGRVRFRVMRGATGGRVAAPLWTRFMAAAVPLQRLCNQKRGKNWRIEFVKYSVEPIEKEGLKQKQPAYEMASSLADSIDTIFNSHSALGDEGLQNSTVIYAPNPPLVSRAWGAASAEGGVTVPLCADSGHLAGEYCRVTVSKRISPDAEESLRICSRHRPPAGEPFGRVTFAGHVGGVETE